MKKVLVIAIVALSIFSLVSAAPRKAAKVIAPAAVTVNVTPTKSAEVVKVKKFFKRHKKVEAKVVTANVVAPVKK